MLLEVRNLSVNYGYIEALRDVSIDCKEGTIISIIGSNGAGKTTLLRTVSGLVKPVAGEVRFQGKSLPAQAHKIVEEGVVHVPEGRKTFAGLTVADNLLAGGYLQNKARIRETMEKQYKLFPILEKRKNQFAGTLSGGEQQMLAIARGMMSHPKILLLDEPSLGLAPIIVNQVYDLIQEIKNSGVTILLVEQNAKKALSICDYAYVLENGRIKLQGKGSELLNSEEVKKAYLAG